MHSCHKAEQDFVTARERASPRLPRMALTNPALVMFILSGHVAREDGLNSHREGDAGSGHFKLHKPYMYNHAVQ